jgi:methylene-fatty-acyl-phospholipid synthase
LYRVYLLLGEDGVYYGARFGKKLPWVEKFPFGYFRDPQYVGSILSLFGVSCWVPWHFIALWILGYIFMMFIEREEDPNTRAEHIS